MSYTKCAACSSTGYNNGEVCGCVDDWVNDHFENGDFGDLFGFMPAPYRLGLADRLNQKLPTEASWNHKKCLIDIHGIATFKPSDDSMPFWEAVELVKAIIQAREQLYTIKS